MTAPVFMAATTTTDGLTVQMLFDQPLQVTPTAPASAFAVMVAAAAATISAVTVNGSQVNLTLSTAITNGQTVTVAYTAPADDAATTNAAVQNASGEDAASVSATSVTNNVPVHTAPVFKSANTSADGLDVVLIYDQTIQSAPSAPAPDFTVKVDGVAATITAVNTSGLTVVLVLSKAITVGQVVTVAYAAPAADPANTNQAVQNAAGQDAASIPETAVVNTSTVPAAAPVTPVTPPVTPAVTPAAAVSGSYSHSKDGIVVHNRALMLMNVRSTKN